eukprot:CAMPEP_0181316588 /NCGR_PEP_ID=MMETSP1101-20121128/15976_1 /TAXON_ID=46948 /ORGANISM="Rhodomonas abbreviata, Strain Caron Lab Isolate" /LENGTH=280 /DNA_ID=CAMNT_0023423847 /DNA_START=34 /DNA_END=876 /DNA_ORIENTATION=+
MALALALFVGVHAKLGKVPVGSDEELAAQQMQAFHTSDTNGDGSISMDEYIEMLSATLKAAGKADMLDGASDEFKLAFSKIDTDGSGGINMQEWKEMITAGVQKAQEAERMQGAAAEEKLRMAYDSADGNKDGQLTQAEMLEGFKQYGYTPEQIEQFFSVGDLNKDNLLTFEEFQAGRDQMQRKQEMEALMEGVQSEEQQEQAFQEADGNADGSLSLLEYEKVFTDFLVAMGGKAEDVDPAVVMENFKQYDLDGSGFVSMNEWKSALKANMAREAGKQEL